MKVALFIMIMAFIFIPFLMEIVVSTVGVTAMILLFVYTLS